MKTKTLCVNRIIAEGLFDIGFKNKKEIISEDGVNPEYIEVIIDSRLTEEGVRRLTEYVSNNSDKDIKTLNELKEFLGLLSSQSQKDFVDNPLLVFWNED